jgi:hypothetical protein
MVIARGETNPAEVVVSLSDCLAIVRHEPRHAHAPDSKALAYLNPSRPMSTVACRLHGSPPHRCPTSKRIGKRRQPWRMTVAAASVALRR